MRSSRSGGCCDSLVCPVPYGRDAAVLTERYVIVLRKARFIREALSGKRNTPGHTLRSFRHWGATRLRGQPIVSGPVSRVRVSETAGLANVLINTVGGSVDIGDYVFFGHDVLLLTGTHDFAVKGLDRQVPHKKLDRSIVIENGAWIASRSVIIGPCRIGANAVIGCGCVVDFDVPADTVVRVRQEVVKDTIRYRGSPRPGQVTGGGKRG
jgi:acetyltransferase-like isoleucine patch superfamily enzyme